MQPYRAMTIDNRPPLPVFLEGNPLTDGLAHFAASLIQAPQAARQTERQQQERALGELFRRRVEDRQAEQDALAKLWGEQDRAERSRLNDATIGNMEADNARQNLALLFNNPLLRGLAGAMAGRSGTGRAATEPKLHMIEVEDEDGNITEVPHILQNGRLMPVPMGAEAAAAAPGAAGAGAAPAAEPTAAAGDPGWPVSATVAGYGGGALAAGKLASMGPLAAQAGAPAARAGAMGALKDVFGNAGAKTGRLLPVAPLPPVAPGVMGRLGGIWRLAARGAVPLTVAQLGYEGAAAGYNAVQGDITPVAGDPRQVLEVYATGKGFEPGAATQFGKALTTRPNWLEWLTGPPAERVPEAIDRLHGQHVREVTGAAAQVIPPQHPDRARILAALERAAWNDEPKARRIIQGLLQSEAAGGLPVTPEGMREQTRAAIASGPVPAVTGAAPDLARFIR